MGPQELTFVGVGTRWKWRRQSLFSVTPGGAVRMLSAVNRSLAVSSALELPGNCGFISCPTWLFPKRAQTGSIAGQLWC